MLRPTYINFCMFALCVYVHVCALNLTGVYVNQSPTLSLSRVSVNHSQSHCPKSQSASLCLVEAVSHLVSVTVSLSKVPVSQSLSSGGSQSFSLSDSLTVQSPSHCLVEAVSHLVSVAVSVSSPSQPVRLVEAVSHLVSVTVSLSKVPVSQVEAVSPLVSVTVSLSKVPLSQSV